MGEQITKFRLRREARRRFGELNKKRDTYVILHYSCESFYDIKDGRTPRVTSIAARNFSTGQTLSFSIHKSAEQSHVSLSEITERYDELERHMLDEFFDFLKSRHERWSPSLGQVGGEVKVDRLHGYAARESAIPA